MPTWTYEENAMLVKIADDYEGHNWAAISAFFPQRSQEACERHYHLCLKQHHEEWLKVSSPIMGAMFLITDEELAAYDAQRVKYAAAYEAQRAKCAAADEAQSAKCAAPDGAQRFELTERDLRFVWGCDDTNLEVSDKMLEFVTGP